jgi:hypothetical protein
MIWIFERYQPTTTIAINVDPKQLQATACHTAVQIFVFRYIQDCTRYELIFKVLDVFAANLPSLV